MGLQFLSLIIEHAVVLAQGSGSVIGEIEFWGCQSEHIDDMTDSLKTQNFVKVADKIQ